MSQPEFRNTFYQWEVHKAALKHGILTADSEHAASNALVCYPLDDDNQEGAVRELRLDPDQAGNMLEIVVLRISDKRSMIIHSMRMRPEYRSLLP